MSVIIVKDKDVYDYDISFTFDCILWHHRDIFNNFQNSKLPNIKIFFNVLYRVEPVTHSLGAFIDGLIWDG